MDSQINRMFSISLLCLLVAQIALSQDDFECPAGFGFFADSLQCDRYYECKDGQRTENLCPDGLVFDKRSHVYAKCSFPFSIDCTGREERQTANPTPGCPRQQGYFPDPDPEVCDQFNFCVDGAPSTIKCPGGLIYNPESGQCAYSDQTTRTGCTSEELFQFQCPDKTVASPFQNSRHPDPEDCQYFYLCIEGKARRNGCQIGMVFNPTTLACDEQDKVEGPCSNWYNSTFVESLKPKPTSVTRKRVVNRRRRPSRPQTQNVASRQPVRTEAPLPQQLADLEGFGQQSNADVPTRRAPPQTTESLPPQLASLAKFGEKDSGDKFTSNNVRNPVRTTFDRPPRPAVRDDLRTRGSISRTRPEQQKGTREENTRSKPEDRRTRVRNNQNTLGSDKSRRPFTRPPFRRPGKGGPRQEELNLSREENLERVSAVPRERGSGLSRERGSVLSRERGSGLSRERGYGLSRERGSEVSRESISSLSRDVGKTRQNLATSSDEDEKLESPRQTSRSRLEVIEIKRPPLVEFDEDEFDIVRSERQRNRG